MLAFLVPAALNAVVKPAPMFQDNAVLQRGKPVPVWGAADPGERVTVSFGGAELSAVADAAGKWRIDLPAMEGSGEPRELRIVGTNTIVAKNVVVGEVWIASGQSNMEWPMARAHDVDMERRTARLPQIREIKVPRVPRSTPASEFEGSWKVATPENLASLSAVAYHFAKDVHLALDVPVGILNTTWGGTAIEPWLSPRSESDPSFAASGERWAKSMETYPQRKADYDQALQAWRTAKAAVEARGEVFREQQPREPMGPNSQAQPFALHHGMVAPLIPYAIRGAIWYQGEGNAGRPEEYHGLFSALIRGWREDFAQGDFPFFWVQLATFRASDSSGTNWAFLREAQDRTLALPNTGQAIAIDVAVMDLGDIHPRAKGPIGRRLARLALARAYGLTDVVDSGPVFNRDAFAAQSEPNAEGELKVTFLPANRKVRQPLETITGFEVAGEDRVFYPATARFTDNAILVKSASVAKPVAVRYAWRNGPIAALQDDLGLPVPPFRTDTW